MIPTDPVTWMLVFSRCTAMLVIFPIFSTSNIPLQLRVALGALLAYFISATLPPAVVAGLTIWGLIGLLVMETCVGLLLGFVGRILFYALDVAGSAMATEMGLMLTADFNPFSSARSDAPAMTLNLLAITLFLSLDLHHWFLLGLQRTYSFVPIGGAHLSAAVLTDVVERTSGLFLIALQIAAPVIAVSFIIALVFAVLGRAVPQMNVFSESFAFRTMGGLIVFGLTLQLMAQHITNYLYRLPDDILRVAQLIGAG
jgi:flagellar biosynthetic protein FliR